MFPIVSFVLLGTTLIHLTFFTHSRRLGLPTVLQNVIQRWRLNDSTVTRPSYPFLRTLLCPLVSWECTMIVSKPVSVAKLLTYEHICDSEALGRAV